MLSGWGSSMLTREEGSGKREAGNTMKGSSWLSQPSRTLHWFSPFPRQRISILLSATIGRFVPDVSSQRARRDPVGNRRRRLAPLQVQSSFGLHDVQLDERAVHQPLDGFHRQRIVE